MEINPIDVQIGAKLRNFRLLNGLSQEDIGKIVGITFQQIQKYEKGYNRIGASRLYEFAQILNKHPGDFFENFEDTSPPSDKKTLLLIKLFNKLSLNKKQIVLSLLKVLQ